MLCQDKKDNTSISRHTYARDDDHQTSFAKELDTDERGRAAHPGHGLRRPVDA